MAGSTPIYGFPYPQSTDLVADYPTLGQELATDVETVISGLGSGLNLITPTSIANSGGTATLSGGTITFSAVNSVSLNGVFSNTYENYVIIWKVTSTTSGDINMRFRTSGTDNSGTNYSYSNGYIAAGIFGNGGYSNSGATYYIFSYNGNSGGSNGEINIFSPFLSEPTAALYNFSYRQTDPIQVRSMGGARYNSATSFDGFTMYPASSTITGNVRVYGREN